MLVDVENTKIILLDVKANYSQSTVAAIRDWQVLTDSQHGSDLVELSNTNAKLMVSPASGSDPVRYGAISTDLTGSGLNACQYRKLSFKLTSDAGVEGGIWAPAAASRFSSAEALLVKLDYTYIENNKRHCVKRLVAVTANDMEAHLNDEDDEDAQPEDEYVLIEKILPVPAALDLESLKITIENRWLAFNGTVGISVYVSDVKLTNSYDIASGQMTDTILWGCSVDRVEAYNNGCRIYYLNSSEFTQLRWSEDSQTGLFNGVYVSEGEGEERLISFQAFDRDL